MTSHIKEVNTHNFFSSVTKETLTLAIVALYKQWNYVPHCEYSNASNELLEVLDCCLRQTASHEGFDIDPEAEFTLYHHTGDWNYKSHFSQSFEIRSLDQLTWSDVSKTLWTRGFLILQALVSAGENRNMNPFYTGFLLDLSWNHQN